MQGLIATVLILGSVLTLVLAVIGVLFARVPIIRLRGRVAWDGVGFGALVALILGAALVPATPSARPVAPNTAHPATSAQPNPTARPTPTRLHRLRVTLALPLAIAQVFEASGLEVARMRGANAHFNLRPGVYFVRASATGYLPVKSRLELRGPRHLSFALKRDLIMISLDANAPSAAYRVYNTGGQLVARAQGTSARFNLPRARYKIAVAALGYRPTALWSQGGSARATLDRLPPPPPPLPAVALESPASGSSGGGYVNSAGEFVPSPVFSDRRPEGASAQCGDGSYSFSRSRRGTCSHHGGVAQWY